jgi:hypothetical protein
VMASLKALYIGFVLTFAVPAGLAACPVCFRFEETTTVSGVRVAVGVLVGVTVVVLAAFATFAVRLARREAAGEASRQ